MTVADHSQIYAGFMERIGLPGEGLDAAGRAALDVDGHPVHIEYQPSGPHLVLTLPLGVEAGPMTVKVARAVLKAGHAAASAGVGTVGLDDGGREFVLVERIALEGLDVDAMAQAMQAILDRADDWRRLLADAAGPDADAAAPFELGMMRV